MNVLQKARSKTLGKCVNKMKAILFFFSLAMCVATSVFARGGKLSSVTLAFPEGTTTSAAKQVTDYLNKEVTLREGSFINEFVTQRFSGSTENLNNLIPLLLNSQFDLTMVGADLKDADVSFSLFQHMADPGKVTLTINTTKKDFNWSELKVRIPTAGRDGEPHGAAKGSHPSRSATIRTSPAADSRR